MWVMGGRVPVGGGGDVCGGCENECVGGCGRNWGTWVHV